MTVATPSKRAITVEILQFPISILVKNRDRELQYLERICFYARIRLKLTALISFLKDDFILYGEKGLLAFEIKRKKKLKSSDFKHLYVFAEDYPIAKRYVLYGEEERYTQQDIEVIPFAQGINTLLTILTD